MSINALNSLDTGNFCMIFCRLLIFFKIPSECQTVRVQIGSGCCLRRLSADDTDTKSWLAETYWIRCLVVLIIHISVYPKPCIWWYLNAILVHQPGRIAQWVACLATDACLTADPGVASSILVRSHTFVEIDHEMISTVILLPSADSFKKGCCQLQAKVCARITD